MDGRNGLRNLPGPYRQGGGASPQSPALLPNPRRRLWYNPKPEIWNSNGRTQNLEFETRDQPRGVGVGITQNPKLETLHRNPKLETRNPKLESSRSPPSEETSSVGFGAAPNPGLGTT
jgi:hypothetical protein